MRNYFARLTAAILAASFVTCAAIAAPQADYGGLWWNPSESGWGVTVDHQGDILFATLLTYDAAGQPVWYVMSRMDRRDSSFAAPGNNYQGPMYRAGANSVNADRSSLFSTDVSVTNIGNAGFSFDSDLGNYFWYDIAGFDSYKTITPLVFADSVPVCEAAGKSEQAPNFQGMWGDEPGWAIYAAHQADTIFAVWLGYDGAGFATWYSMELSKTAPNTYAGPVIRSTGPAYDTTFDPNAVTRTTVGSARLEFADRDNGVFASVMGDVPLETRNITRQVFGAPRNTCD